MRVAFHAAYGGRATLRLDDVADCGMAARGVVKPVNKQRVSSLRAAPAVHISIRSRLGIERLSLVPRCAQVRSVAHPQRRDERSCGG
jgi:hypothetical protein